MPIMSKTLSSSTVVRYLPSPSRSFVIQGSPIVTEPDLLQAVIVGCPQVGPGIKPCTKITAILVGQAREFLVDGQVPLLEHLQATTDGVPPGFCTTLSNTHSNVAIGAFVLSPQALTLQAAYKTGAPFCEP